MGPAVTPLTSPSVSFSVGLERKEASRVTHGRTQGSPKHTRIRWGKSARTQRFLDIPSPVNQAKSSRTPLFCFPESRWHLAEIALSTQLPFCFRPTPPH